MAHARLHRPACFDRAGRLLDDRLEFVVTPPAGRQSLSAAGAVFLAGEQLDKRRVDPRRLRQMYDARLIALAPGQVVPTARARRPRALGPAVDQVAAAPPPASRPRGVPRRRLSRATA